MITFIILVVAAITIAVIVEIILRRQQPDKTTALASVEEKMTTIFSQVVEEAGEIAGNIRGKKQPDLTEPFRAWATENVADEELKIWLTSLSEEGLKALTEQLANFCADLNLELAWLVEEELEQEPELKQAAQEIVIRYCLACRKAVQIQDELNIFKTFQDIVNNLSRKENQVVSQKLLTELHQQDLVPTATPELLLASNKQRREYVSQTIRQAANTDRQKFNAILQQVVNHNNSTDENTSVAASATTSKPTRES